MAWTYNISSGTDKDFVRLLIGDTIETDQWMSDEEISMILAEEPATGAARKYFAAATALASLHTHWTNQGKGILEKQVGRTRLRRGVDTSSDSAILRLIDDLRRQGAERLVDPSPVKCF